MQTKLTGETLEQLRVDGMSEMPDCWSSLFSSINCNQWTLYNNRHHS